MLSIETASQSLRRGRILLIANSRQSRELLQKIDVVRTQIAAFTASFKQLSDSSQQIEKAANRASDELGPVEWLSSSVLSRKSAFAFTCYTISARNELKAKELEAGISQADAVLDKLKNEYKRYRKLENYLTERLRNLEAKMRLSAELWAEEDVQDQAAFYKAAFFEAAGPERGWA